MRIVQVTPRFPPAIGGMENHVYTISIELIRRGHEVIVVTSDDIDGGKNSIKENVDIVDGIKVYRHPLLFRRIIREYWLVSDVARTLKNLHADGVHTHGFRCLSSCVATYWCKKNKVPVILTPHGIYPPRSLGNALIKSIYDYSFGNLLLKFSRRIVALTENNKQLLLKIGAPRDKIVMIPNGVDVAKYRKIRSSNERRKKHGFDGPVLLYVGRIDWNKGLEKVIEAMPMITKEFGYAKFLIVGPDYANYSRNLLYLARKLGVHDSIFMTGRVSEEQLFLYYSIADIFIFPSIYEAFGLSLLEAMASYVPVVASKSGGIKDILVDGVHALLLKDCSPQEIFNSVSMLLHDSKLKEKLRENAFNLVSRKYGWDAVVDKIEALYKEVFNKTKT